LLIAIQNTYHRSAADFEKQRASIKRRGSCANVVAILITSLEAEVVLVERSSTHHPGWALPSGSVCTQDEESILKAFWRETKEETGVKADPTSVRPHDVEVRRFVNTDTGETAHVIVGTIIGQVAAGQVAHLTPEARAENILSVREYRVDALPDLIFDDGTKILQALGRAA
jgi:ADP-ribose pyrophosphatase YjhB (NUDIX family)